MKFIYLLIIVLLFNSFDSNVSNVNDDSYNLHSLSFVGLSTNNFFDYFSDIDVVRIYPYVNPIYSDRIGNIYYDFSFGNFVYSFNKFKDEYLSLIKKNSYLDYNYLFVNGVNIDRVDVYLSDRQFNEFINNNNLVISVIK